MSVLLRWIPFYFALKLAFLAWCFLPQTQVKRVTPLHFIEETSLYRPPSVLIQIVSDFWCCCASMQKPMLLHCSPRPAPDVLSFCLNRARSHVLRNIRRGTARSTRCCPHFEHDSSCCVYIFREPAVAVSFVGAFLEGRLRGNTGSRVERINRIARRRARLAFCENNLVQGRDSRAPSGGWCK